MPLRSTMNILILEEHAEGYREHLAHVPDKLSFATALDDVGERYDILLAQPDLAAAYILAGGRVDWIQSTWAGVRPLADALSGSGVVVTGIKQVFGPQIAEYVFTYVLDELRNPMGYRAAQRQQRWQPVLPRSLNTRHMVVAGTGDIGTALAVVARSFGMRVTGVSREGEPKPEFDLVLPAARLRGALNDADYVVVALPDTADATDLFDADAFSAMAQRPLLVNVGRGSSVVDEALISALRAGQVRGAILDVFDTEPLPEDDPLWLEPGVVITPHVAAVSYPADIANIFLSNLERYRAGARLDFLVDLERGY